LSWEGVKRINQIGIMEHIDSDEILEREQLHEAAYDGDLNKVKELVAKGFKVNVFDDDLSRTPLHCAVIEGYIEMAQYLLSVGAVLFRWAVLNNVVDGLINCFNGDGFTDETIHPNNETGGSFGLLIVRCHRNDGSVRGCVNRERLFLGSYLPGGFDTSDNGHLQIHEYDIVGSLQKKVHGFLAVFSGGDFMPFFFQQPSD
jgi:hypothetical protein